jgi:propanol-preferring alcohol dehydrogenase
MCAAVPPGGRLGIYGFGGSAHLTAQLALAQGLTVHVLTRGEANQQLARQLGAHSVGGVADDPPEPLDGAILFAPAGELVPGALRALDRGGTPPCRHLAIDIRR